MPIYGLAITLSDAELSTQQSERVLPALVGAFGTDAITEVATWGRYHVWRLTHTIEAPTMLSDFVIGASVGQGPSQFEMELGSEARLRRINPARIEFFAPTAQAASGGVPLPVGRPDFKSGWGRQTVSGGFDSHPPPPLSHEVTS